MAQSQLKNEEPQIPRKGRPRSEKSKKSIIKATNSLLLHMSVQELSIEAIAKKAKVGKTTIYRWWPNKTAVIMEALSNQPGMQTTMPTPKNNADALCSGSFASGNVSCNWRIEKNSRRPSS